MNLQLWLNPWDWGDKYVHVINIVHHACNSFCLLGFWKILRIAEAPGFSCVDISKYTYKKE